MKLVPQGSVRRTAVLASCLALAGVYLIHAYIHAPRVESTLTAEARLHRLLEGIRDSEAGSTVDVGDLERRLASYRRSAEQLGSLIPSRDEVPALMSAIAMEERRAGVEMTMLRPESPEPGVPYQRWSYQLAVRGSYHAIGSFIAGIGSLDRIVAADDMVVSAEGADTHAGGSGQATVVASFRMRLRVKDAEGADNHVVNELQQGNGT